VDQARLREALKLLSTHYGVGSALCAAVADGRIRGAMELRQWCLSAGLAQSRGDEVVAFLDMAASLRLVEQSSALSWRVSEAEILARLAPMLEGIQVYRDEVHVDRDRVEVVLTKPPNPSQMAKRLDEMLLGSWGLLDTREMLPVLAEKAKSRFLVMTPFLDDTGAEIVTSLFRNTQAGVRRQLILRKDKDSDWPPGYISHGEALRKLGVEVFNFRLDKDMAGNETFHAKVVLADASDVYVGSSNMLKWSFDYSMELGLAVSGRAANRIADIMDAVCQVAEQVT